METINDYVYMHTHIPLLFQIWQYSEFHNSIFPFGNSELGLIPSPKQATSRAEKQIQSLTSLEFMQPVFWYVSVAQDR